MSVSGKDIRAARRARDLSQEGLGAALHPPVTRSTVSMWERDLMLPSGPEVYEYLGLDAPGAGGAADRAPATARRGGLDVDVEPDRPLDALPDAVLIARAQDHNAQAAQLMAILAGRISSSVRSVQPPQEVERARMRRGPLDEADRPAVEDAP